MRMAAPFRTKTVLDNSFYVVKRVVRPTRTHWIDLSDLHARGVVVIWSDGDRTTLPTEYAAIAPRSRGT
jgi:hypothetical protein